MSELDNVKQQTVEYIKTMLGDGMVDVELDPKHYDIAIQRALMKYRQRAQNSTEESYAFLTLKQNINEYTLPNEVMEVRQIFRRSIGSRSGGGDGGSLFEPFNLAYTNTYLLSSSNMGGLATYFAFAGYQKLVGKMFGSFINFDYNSTTKKLRISQRPQGEESVLRRLLADDRDSTESIRGGTGRCDQGQQDRAPRDQKGLQGHGPEQIGLARIGAGEEREVEECHAPRRNRAACDR